MKRREKKSGKMKKKWRKNMKRSMRMRWKSMSLIRKLKLRSQQRKKRAVMKKK